MVLRLRYLPKSKGLFENGQFGDILWITRLEYLFKFDIR